MSCREGAWNSLPSVILVEILSYLTHSDRISAASACKQWRSCLFHPSFWEQLACQVSHEGLSRTRFLSRCVARKVRSASLTIDATDAICVEAALDVLTRLGGNGQLRTLTIRPTHGRMDWPGRNTQQQATFINSMVESLENIARNSSKLRALSLGCMEEIVVRSELLLTLLEQNQAGSLEQLHLATVKDDPDSYLLVDIPVGSFRSLRCLKALSLDNDYVTNELLQVFSQRPRTQLARLNILVHGIDEGYPGTSDAAWAQFAQFNPGCEVRLTLLHSYDAIEVLHSHILRPSMPLTHFRAYFCEQLNIQALHQISTWFAPTLRSFVTVDSLRSPNRYKLIVFLQQFIETPDPLVMMAWSCKKLRELVFIGYEYFEQDLIAIARLRGPQLSRLEMCERDIVCGMAPQSRGPNYVVQEVSNALERPWKPVPPHDLPDVIRNPSKGESDSYFLPTILADQDF